MNRNTSDQLTMSETVIIILLTTIAEIGLLVLLTASWLNRHRRANRKSHSATDAQLHGIGFGLAIGVGTGIALGAATGNIALGITLGAAIGVALGATLGQSFMESRRQKHTPDNKQKQTAKNSFNRKAFITAMMLIIIGFSLFLIFILQKIN